MLSFLPHFLRGSLAGLLLVSSTLCWACLLFGMTLVKLLLPFAAAQRLCSKIMSLIAEGWIACNKGWMNLVQRTRWNVQGLEGLEYQHSYLVTSNHQSWVDILVLQYQLNRRIPLLRFFLKQELIWVPIIGLCWWALDFPFMKRYSKAYLARHPEKKGQDLATTRKACAKFSCIPVAVFNFLEGGQRDHPLPGRQPDLLVPAFRTPEGRRGALRGTGDSAPVRRQELRPGRRLPRGIPAMGQPAVGAQGPVARQPAPRVSR